AAIDVSVTGNSLTADQVEIKTSDGAAGIRARAGGNVNISNSSIETVGTGLYATGKNSIITASNTDISIKRPHSFGATAQDGGRVELDGGSINIIADGAHGINLTGATSSMVAKNLDITVEAEGSWCYGASVRDGRLTLENVK